MGLKVYSTGCPKCRQLEKMLTAKGYEFTLVSDIEEMKKIGLKSAPALKIDEEKILSFEEAMKWIHDNKNNQSY